MRDTKWRYLYLQDPIQIQTWLEDWSLEGWKLEEIRYNFGRFRRIEPHRIRYRLEPTERLWEDKPLRYYEEKDRLYAEMGWHLVGKALGKMCYIYCTEDSEASELHTDADIQKELWRRMRGRILRWNLLLLFVALSRGLPVLNGLFWSEGNMASSDLVWVTWSAVLSGVMWAVVLVLNVWKGWQMCRPYRRLRRGDSGPYEAYSTSFWGRWYLWILFFAVWAISLSITSGVWGTFGGTDAFPMGHVDYGYGELLPDREYLLYIDAEALETPPEASENTYVYTVRANTFTAVYYNNISQTVTDQNHYRAAVKTQYFHMRGAYFTQLLLEKILAATTAVEETGFPGADQAWVGIDDDDNAFLLARRGNQVVRFYCDEEMDLMPYMGMVVDLLDRAIY